MIGLNSPRRLDQTRRINELASHIRNSQIQLSKSNQLLRRFHDSLELYNLFSDRQAREIASLPLHVAELPTGAKYSPVNNLAATRPISPNPNLEPGPNSNTYYRCTQPRSGPTRLPSATRQVASGSNIATQYQRRGSHP